MGGRGASSASGSYKRGGQTYEYGDEYRTLFQEDNIKFIKIDDKHDPTRPITAPIETRTKGRIYATVNKEDGRMHSISVMGGDGKVRVQLDYQDHRGMGAHAHDWDFNAKKVRSNARTMSEQERSLYNRVNEIYRKHTGRTP